MYFSLISPVQGHEREAAHQRLGAPYSDHQWLWQWFPAEQGAPRDFLFRRHESQGKPRYYVLSKRPPPEKLGAWHAQVQPYAPQLASGDVLQFELRANPTVRHGRDGKSKRHDVVMEAKKKLLQAKGLKSWKEWTDADRPDTQAVAHQACSEWLARRAQALGFELDVGSLRVEGYNQHLEKPDRQLQFSTVDLAGLLTITEVAAFQTALFNGIGSAKAFGCGLLLVRRAG